MMYGMTGTNGPEANSQRKNWTTLADLEQDVVNFLLLRGDHAYLTSGCVHLVCSCALGWSFWSVCVQ